MSKNTLALRMSSVLNKVKSATHSTGKTPLKYIGRVIDFWAGINLSIRMKILLSLGVVILLMGSTNVWLVMQVLNYSSRYDAIINNITTANSISRTIKPDIDNEMWRVVAGKVNFDQGSQYTIINDVNAKVQGMIANTNSPRAKVKLDVILRTMRTLKEKVDEMGRQMARSSTVTENEAVLEDIRFVTGVVAEVVQEYALFEVERDQWTIPTNTGGFCSLGGLIDHPHHRRSRLFGGSSLEFIQEYLYPHQEIA